MSEQTYTTRYDQFQNDAVDAISDDFAESPDGRFLLVVPTGGGKTFVAVRAISRLFEMGLLDESEDRVGWVAHRDELLRQASGTFGAYEGLYAAKNYESQVDFMMLGEARATYEAGTKHKIVVIDEAHHGAAPSYQPIFQAADVGVLGLTATPSRHDGIPLDFDRESYSIGFPDLVELGVVLRPEVITIAGGKFDIDAFDDESLNELADAARYQRIIQALLEKSDAYQKVVVYAGTREIARGLYDAMMSSSLVDEYDSISYVLGDENSRGLDRKAFFDVEKSLKRSIIVNVQVLSEGYDDPTINTVVMAAPTKSKLVYMQAMGRAIRHDPDNPLKRAYVLEIVDELPNIRYRIDNRWLFSDVSDTLEPAVDDIDYSTESELVRSVEGVYNQYEVPASLRLPVTYDPKDRVTMLLFKFKSPQGLQHMPVVMRNANRTQIVNVFNYLSQRMDRFHSKVAPEAAYSMARAGDVEAFGDPVTRHRIYNSLENQAACIDETAIDAVREGYPWVSFVSFRWRRADQQLPPDWISFCEDMINREQILGNLREGAFEDGFVLVKMPLPLGQSIGRVVSPSEFEQISSCVRAFDILRETEDGTDHRAALVAAMNDVDLPLEWGFVQSIPIIIRESLDYYRELTK